MVRPIFEHADREMLVVLSLDTALAPLAMEIVAVGSINACGVDVRDLFKHSILSNAPKIICFHNHPSGTMNASQEDILITERIKAAGDLLGIELVDHIIIGLNGTYISFLESGIRPFGDWQGAA
ncbi:MAG: JAB domain-containing protein [Clostridiales bacterium]|nr:JAB domain-containing protein [Clostridiales bacterium]